VYLTGLNLFDGNGTSSSFGILRFEQCKVNHRNVTIIQNISNPGMGVGLEISNATADMGQLRFETLDVNLRLRNSFMTSSFGINFFSPGATTTNILCENSTAHIFRMMFNSPIDTATNILLDNSTVNVNTITFPATTTTSTNMSLDKSNMRVRSMTLPVAASTVDFFLDNFSTLSVPSASVPGGSMMDIDGGGTTATATSPDPAAVLPPFHNPKLSQLALT